MGTDIVRRWGFDAEMRRRDARLPNRKLVVMDDPFADGDPEPVVLVPAINPDVTVIHVQQADTQGTVRIAGLTFADRVHRPRTDGHRCSAGDTGWRDPLLRHGPPASGGHGGQAHPRPRGDHLLRDRGD